MLKVDHITKAYGKKTALANVSLEIPPGNCFGLVGPNGAGKSTLLKIIAKVIRDYQGKVRQADMDRTIGYVPQEIALEETVTAQDNLLFFGKLYGLSREALRLRIAEVLEEIGLTERAKDKVVTFSGGMKRRLNIGCALLHQPDLIIMDEPTVGIDPQSRQYIFQMIEQLKQKGTTIIYASHYMEEIERICDEAVFLDHGEVIESGEISAILQKHGTPSIFVRGEDCLPEEIEKLGDIQEKEEGYLLITSAPLHAMELIVGYCKQNGTYPERLELAKPRLEDVFFSLTGNLLRE
ncbi:ABC transporter ATP-binding protein [Oceanobacillus alkalisoli]|uniref:ABC transporter ATP-binding protein n=1 Tax=Oceanobacillus alkalisoli TaxID=2925113 RepID=UPI001F11FE92|nr:ABC transporter ATP-binding protein [Oceanobacillus alkalisoli]MCF3943385.1 ABC transporter ATP-binding protein [Oceanobacillus alkalisoli]